MLPRSQGHIALGDCMWLQHAEHEGLLNIGNVGQETTLLLESHLNPEQQHVDVSTHSKQAVTGGDS